MASLRSLIRDKRTGVACNLADLQDPKLFAEERFSIREARKALDSPMETTLVNNQGVYDSIMEQAPDAAKDMELAKKLYDWYVIPRPRPPYRKMWLECIQQSGRHIGTMVTTHDFGYSSSGGILREYLQQWSVGHWRMLLEKAEQDRPASIVFCDCWQEQQALGALMGRLVYWLDADGKMQWSFRTMARQVSREKEKMLEAFICCHQSLVMHTFARLNCKNVELAKMAAGAPKIKRPGSHPPFSVWHEIVVRSKEEMRRREQGEVLPDGEKRDLRFHSVRGHYADYTQGTGLFGKYKVQLWIEEHDRGNPEMGAVNKSYKVE